MALLAVLFFAVAKADVVEPGQVYRRFLVNNINKFSAYKFYFIHQGYYYDKGYHAGTPDTVLVENNKRYQVSDHGNEKSVLLAVDKNGKWFSSGIKLGGETKLSPAIAGIVDVYSISSIKDSIVKLKKAKEIVLYRNGKEKEKKAGTGFASFIGGDGFSKGLIISSGIALLALLFIVIKIKRKPKYIHLAT